MLVAEYYSTDGGSDSESDSEPAPTLRPVHLDLQSSSSVDVVSHDRRSFVAENAVDARWVQRLAATTPVARAAGGKLVAELEG